MNRGARWRVGVAGLARAGIWRALRQWLSMEEVDLAAAADRDGGRRRRALRMGVPRVYEEPREMLARETLDILHVATSPLEHESLVASALMRGLDLLVEPPLAIGARAARKLVASSRTYGGFLIPVWPAAFDPLWQALVTHAGEAGPPSRLHARLQVGWEPWWDDLDEEIQDDPQLPLPGALALGGDQLVHLAVALFGMPAEVAAQAHRQEFYGRPWDQEATLLLTYPWGTVRLEVRLGLDPGSSIPSGETRRGRVLLDGARGRLEVRGRRLVRWMGGGLRRDPHDLAFLGAGPGAEAPRWLVAAMAGRAGPGRGLDRATLGAVCRVLAVLERSAAAAGARYRLDEPPISGGLPVPEGL